jgi:hypothetical protein
MDERVFVGQSFVFLKLITTIDKAGLVKVQCFDDMRIVRSIFK